MTSLSSKKFVDYYIGGFLIFLLRPLVWFIGLIIRRDHSIQPRKKILFIKMWGGGSLILAYPALHKLREEYPNIKFMLLTIRSMRSYGQLTKIFDEIICIDDRSFIGFFLSGLKAWFKCFLVDTVIDYEVYSRSTTILSLSLFSRNRIGFYSENIFWRKYINTHLIYFNPFSLSSHFYDQISYLFSDKEISVKDSQTAFSQLIPSSAFEKKSGFHVAIGAACSENGIERQLMPQQWVKFLERIETNEQLNLHFLGSKSDIDLANDIIKEIKIKFHQIICINHCGKTTLTEAADIIRKMDEYWGIDSGLLHIARLIGIKSRSIWGPTDPKTRLRSIPNLEEDIMYRKIPCSPCIHVTEKPPCQGNNICMKALFEEYNKIEFKKGSFTMWPKSPKSS